MLADRAEDEIYVAAKVLTTALDVPSHRFPSLPGYQINVRPSGLLSSTLVKPTGSFVTGIPADCMVRAAIFFSV